MKTNVLSLICALICIFPVLSEAQLISVTGYVKDGKNGEGLANVNVFESNSEIGTISNKKGYYKLTLTKGDAELNITNEGFTSYAAKMELQADTMLIITLHPLQKNKKSAKKSRQAHAKVNLKNTDLPDLAQ